MKCFPVNILHSFILTSLLVFSCISELFAGGSFAAPVQVVPAVEIDMAPVKWIPATVIGRHDSKIAAEVEGRINNVVEVGDYIKKNDVIARLDDTTISMQVDEAEAEIIPITARLEFYKREVVRLEKLAEQNNAAKNRLDEVISNRDEMLGQLGIRQSRLAQIKDKYKKTVVYAPFDGVVTERYKAMGEWVDTGDEIIRLINTDDLEIQARVQQSAVSFIRQNSQLTVSDGSEQLIATIKAIVPAGDDISRLYEVRLAFNKPEWLAGHAVRVAIPTADARNVIAVPRDALVIRQKIIKVFRIQENNIAEAVPVLTGIANDHLIEITGDVSAGDLIVVRGNERLRPSQPVTIQQGNQPL